MTKIDGPDAVLKVNEVNNPPTVDVTPTIIDIKIICIGLFDIFRAMAAGIISKPVISRIPIILIDIAISPDNRIIYMSSERRGLIFSEDAISRLTVPASSDFQIMYSIKMNNPPQTQTMRISNLVTAKISPNNKPIISKRIYDKYPTTSNPIDKLE